MSAARRCVECGLAEGERVPGDPDPQVHVYDDVDDRQDYLDGTGGWWWLRGEPKAPPPTDWCDECGWYRSDTHCDHDDVDDPEPGLFPEPPHPDTVTGVPF